MFTAPWTLVSCVWRAQGRPRRPLRPIQSDTRLLQAAATILTLGSNLRQSLVFRVFVSNQRPRGKVEMPDVTYRCRPPRPLLESAPKQYEMCTNRGKHDRERGRGRSDAIIIFERGTGQESSRACALPAQPTGGTQDGGSYIQLTHRYCLIKLTITAFTPSETEPRSSKILLVRCTHRTASRRGPEMCFPVRRGPGRGWVLLVASPHNFGVYVHSYDVTSIKVNRLSGEAPC